MFALILSLKKVDLLLSWNSQGILNRQMYASPADVFLFLNLQIAYFDIDQFVLFSIEFMEV